MSKTAELKLIRASRLAYSGLLVLYPSDLRRRFGAEMAAVFEDSLRETVVERGLMGITGLWKFALWELLTVAAPARLASNVVMAGALSFLVSSVLFLVFFQFVS
jgi:hypothetical protein